MATASVTNTFVNATTIVAADMNTNFTNLVTFLNNNVVHVDGSKAMTADLNMGGFNILNLNETNADGFDWQDWTISGSTGLSIGNGTENGRFAEIGDIVILWGIITLGSTSTVGTGCSVTLPVTASSSISSASTTFGSPIAQFLDNSESLGYVGYVRFEGTTRLRFITWHSSIPTRNAAVDATVPFTWASGDTFAFQYIYQAA